jgi:tripartite-type tricarboxylate transporter receptor subunit TctC
MNRGPRRRPGLGGTSGPGCSARRRLLVLLGAAGLASMADVRSVRAARDAFPSRTVRLVVGQTPGGQTDTMARVLGAYFAARWGASVVVDNVAGAGGLIGGRAVARAAPDGYMLYVGSSANIAWSAMQSPEAGYDPRVAWAPIGRIGRVAFVLAVRNGLGAGNLREFATRARAKSEGVTVASGGEASNSGRALRLFERLARVKVLEVPYKSSYNSVTAVVSGDVDATFCDLAAALPYPGQLRLVAQTGAQRSPLAPDLPTFREAGGPDLVLEPWYGLVAPAHTPHDVIAVLVAALRAALTDPDVARRLAAAGYEVVLDSPDEFAAAIRRELEP